MVAPVLGPIVKPVIETREKGQSGISRLKMRLERTGYRQKKPYNLPLPASMLRQRAFDGSSSTRPGYSNEPIYVEQYGNVIWWPSSSPAKEKVAEAYNDAYKRLVAGLGENAGMGINIAQRKQAMSMMSARVLQLYSFTRHLRRFEFARAADDLNISRKRIRDLTLRKEAKALGNNWLEYHFGWSPLIHDIGSAIDILQSPIKPSHIMGSGSAQVANFSRSIVDQYGSSQSYDRGFSVKVKLGLEVSISNPNLWLANRMGFVNPATVIWDTVPFSFVVDWFVNVSQVIGSYTEFVGLDVQNAYYTTFWRARYEEILKLQSPTKKYTNRIGGINTGFSRILGIGNGPTLRVKKPWQVSATRGATAISLLLQALR